MNRLAKFIDKNRLILLISFAILFVAGIFGILRIKFLVDPNFLFDSENPEFQTLRRLTSEFGSDTNYCVLLMQGPEVFSKEFLTQMRSLSQEIRKIPGVNRVASLDDMPVFHTKTPGKLIPDLSSI